MKLGEKLKNIRTNNSLSMEELKNRLNKNYNLSISKSMISRWENGKSEPLNTYISAYAKEFNLDLNDLLDIENGNPDLTKIKGIKIIKKFKDVPILGEIACGKPIFCQENYDGIFRLDIDLDDPDFSLKANGDSMIDVGIHDGDLVFFRKTNQVENGKIVAILIEDEVTLKRFYKNENEIILQPENKSYSPIIVKQEECLRVQILGEMIGLYSKGCR